MSFLGLLAVGDPLVRKLLGEAVTYTPTVGSPVTVNGVFDLHAERVDVGEVGVSSIGPRVFLTLSELPSDPSVDTGSTVTARGVTYSAYDVQPDGEGGVYLNLNAVV